MVTGNGDANFGRKDEEEHLAQDFNSSNEQHLRNGIWDRAEGGQDGPILGGAAGGELPRCLDRIFSTMASVHPVAGTSWLERCAADPEGQVHFASLVETVNQLRDTYNKVLECKLELANDPSPDQVLDLMRQLREAC